MSTVQQDMAATIGVILAGGLARRMGGGDKTLRVLAGQTVLARIIARVQPQVATLLLNANGDPARFAPYGLPVVPDTLPGHPGPLAGVLAAMEWAAIHRPAARWLLSVPGDAPFLPSDLVARLHAARGSTGRACAASGGRSHPVAGLWPVSAREALSSALAAGQRKVGGFTEGGATAIADWPINIVDPFLNLNTHDDFTHAEMVLALTEQP